MARSSPISKARADIISTDFGWDDEIFLSFLPASHAYEHTGGQHFPIGLGAQIYYAESLEKLAANIEEVRPTIMVVVPRLFEMLRARILKTIEASGGISKYCSGARSRSAPRNTRTAAIRSDLPMDGILSMTLRKKVRGQVRRADEGDGFGRRAAQSRSRAVLPVARTDLPPGLWPDRGGAGDQLQPAEGRDPHGQRRAAGEGCRSADRRGRRDHGPRRARHARLLAQPRGNGASAAAKTAGWRPATSAISTMPGGSSSPTARRI